MSNRFDLEQDIMSCWGIIDDLRQQSGDFLEGYLNADADTVSNNFYGLATVYDVRFNKLWRTFENLCETDFKRLKELESENAELKRGIESLKVKKK